MKVDKFEIYNRINESYTKSNIIDLIKKAKRMVSKDKINSFIEENRDKIDELKDILTDDYGNIDYSKVESFIQKNI